VKTLHKFDSKTKEGAEPLTREVQDVGLIEGKASQKSIKVKKNDGHLYPSVPEERIGGYKSRKDGTRKLKGLVKFW